MVTKLISSLIDRIVPKIEIKTDQKSSARADETLNDLSYEDALLDVEIRSFMRTEYGKKVPPSGVFPRVIRAIKLYREDQAKAVPVGLASRLARFAESLGQAVVATYKYGARLDSSRIVSGSLITALVMLAVWPAMVHSLSNGGQLGQYINVLSSGAGSVPTANSIGTGTIESPTSISAHTSASTLAPTGPTGLPESSGAQSAYTGPGKVHEDPLLMLAQRTGEDPNELKRHSNKQTTDGGTASDGSSQVQTEPNHNRPMVGQD